MDKCRKIDIPFGTYDSELYYQEINIPDGFEAIIINNKIILKRKENEDERIRKTLIEMFSKIGKKDWRDIPTEKIIAWLEKQGEKEQDIRYKYLEELLAADDIYQMAMNDKMIDYAKAKAVDTLSKMYIGRLLGIEKQGEQKPADKVEPNFHEGEWIIRSAEGFKHDTYLIKEVKDYYVCEDLKGRRVTFTFDDVHKNFKLWDISDAKDGDVLVCNEEILLFKSYSVQGRISLYCWHNRQTNTFHSKEVVGTLSTTRNKIYPATKEQRELLFKKMKEEAMNGMPKRRS